MNEFRIVILCFSKLVVDSSFSIAEKEAKKLSHPFRVRKYISSSPVKHFFVEPSPLRC